MELAFNEPHNKLTQDPPWNSPQNKKMAFGAIKPPARHNDIKPTHRWKGSVQGNRPTHGAEKVMWEQTLRSFVKGSISTSKPNTSSTENA